MNREDLYYVLFEQQKDFYDGSYVPREIIPEVLSLLKLNLPLIITGVRRAGKSTLLKLVREKLQLTTKECLYINFNDERLINFSIEDFQKILDFLTEHKYKENCVLFIDEIQEVSHWEKWVDRIKEHHSLLITGSNSKLLSKEISTILTGRSVNLGLYPFSFREYLTFHKMGTTNINIDLKLQAKIRQMFLDYLTLGGIPQVIVNNEDRILLEIYENILYRDIIKRFNRNLEKPIKEMSLYLLSNISKEVSIRSLSKLLGVSNLSTVKSILENFEKSFLFFSVSKFDYSLKKQIQNPHKIYCIDNGFVTKGGFQFSENKGRLLENLIFLELKRRNLDIYYFSGKRECDFVIRDKAKISQVIQICFNLNEENKERELSGLKEAMDKFKLKEGLIITANQDEVFKDLGIKILPAWKWLLQK